MATAQTTDGALLKALNHPLRVAILHTLGGGVASPSDLAEEIGKPLHQIVYHVGRLAELGFIELVEERKRRGTIEHFYRRTKRAWLGKTEWAALSEHRRHSISVAVLEKVWREIGHSVQTGAFDRRDTRHLTESPLLLDEQGWSELATKLDALLAEAHEIAAQSVNRAQESGASDELVPCHLVLMHFEAGERR